MASLRTRFQKIAEGKTTLGFDPLANDATLAETVNRHLASDELDYDEIYAGRAAWRILPPIDHPDEPARCMVSGTGLTHKGSAANRQAMHAADAAPTDSMRMFQWGLEGGRPAPGQVGVSPEWFYKGTGAILRAHGEPHLDKEQDQRNEQ